MQYEIKYSDRKTLSIKINDDATVTVHAPKHATKKEIAKIVKEHTSWIEKGIKKQEEKNTKYAFLSEADIKRLKKEAKKYFTQKTKLFADFMGLKYGRITITSAKTRFGSCSSNKNISFSYRLMLYPEAAREYVIVHELSHLVYMNHSKEFYRLIEKVLPDYKKRRLLLKE